MPGSSIFHSLRARIRHAGLPLALVVGTAAAFTAVRPVAAAQPKPVPAKRAAPPPAATLSHGRFDDVTIRQPVGAPKRFVLWFAEEAPPARRQAWLDALASDGALIAVVDNARLEDTLEALPGKCGFNIGDIENLSRYVQAYYKVQGYFPPILLGEGDGAAIAYALSAAAGTDSVAGAVSTGFCPTLDTGAAICAAGALKLGPPLPPVAQARRAPVRGADGRLVHGTPPASVRTTLRPAPTGEPWFVQPAGDGARCTATAARQFVAGVPAARPLVVAEDDSLPSVRAAIRTLGNAKAAQLAPPPADLKGLPVIEVPAKGAGNTDTFAVFWSGDGGWAGLDKDVAGALAAQGIPVAGVDSLRYFWTERTPQGVAVDLDRIIRYYRQHWKRANVLLIGFSQGADIIPASYNRLPAATKDAVKFNALLSLGKIAAFEFHLSNWLGANNDGLPIGPEIKRMPAAKTLCLYGKSDGDSICPTLSRQEAILQSVPGDHHFGGDYRKVADVVLREAGLAVDPAVEAREP